MGLHIVRFFSAGWQRSGVKSKGRLAVVWIALAMLVLALGPAAQGQENATITGTVTDSSGAVVMSAALTLTNTSTGQERESVSNASGAYGFVNVGVGTYTLTAKAVGFEKYTRTGIVVNVAQTVLADVSLKLGSVEQTVTVEADALQVESQTSEVSVLISGQQVELLSTNGRNVTALAALGLGVSSSLPQFSGVDALTSANGISFNGTRSTHNVYLIDGAEQNDRGCGGCFMNLPSQEAVSEFRTLDSNYSPDYGIGSGGTIILVLKSGATKFHGELYEFNRNTDYNANDYFTNGAGKPRPEFDLNNFGGNLGGPLFIPHVFNSDRKKTFFFWNEEWRRLVQGSSPSVTNTILASNFPTVGQALNYTVPAGGTTPVVPVTSDPAKLALYTADGLTAGQPFPGNVIPANLMDPNAVLELNAGTFPKPNLGTSQYISSVPATDFIREDAVRIDHTFNDKFQLMGHYLHDAMAKSFYPPLWGDSSYPTVGTAMTNPSYTAVIKLTQTYSPTLLNETGFFYSGNKITLTPQAGPGGTFVQPSGWSAVSFFPVANNLMTRMPEIQLQGTPLNTTWSPSYYPWRNGYEGFQYKDDLSWTKGRHFFKFGGGWMHAYKNQQLQYNTNGTAVFSSSAYSGDSYINFLLGDASSFSQLEYLAGKHWVTNTYSAYAQDNWHVSRNLTLNLGVRYDALPHTYERYNLFSNFVPALYDFNLGNPVQSNGTLIPSSLSTFSKTGSEEFYLNGIREAAYNGFPAGNVKNYPNRGWQPRVGFAYNILGDQKTVLRGGLGLFYERVQGNDVYNSALDPPFAYIPSANNVYFSDPSTSALTGLTTTQSFPSNLTAIAYNYKLPGTASFSLGIQRQLAPSVVAVVQYVGSAGWDQSDDRHINTLPLTDPSNTTNPYDLRKGVANGTLNPNMYRNYPGFGDIAVEEVASNFHYNSLQAGIRFENKHGLTAQLAYTWSHEIDNTANDLGGLSDPYNAAYDKGSGAIDHRHIFNASYVYALPFYRHTENAFARLALGGWSISGITQIQSGSPLNLYYTGPDTLGLGGGTTNRPNEVAAVSYPKTVNEWFSTSSFADPVAPWNGGTNQGFGDAGRDAVVGPGLFNWNLSLFKAFELTKSETGPRFELRFESYNTFNHPQWTGVDTGNHDSNFGHVTSDYGPRTLELGAKFVF
jgi:hypothetical protein